jgi:hypothetical protein
MVRLSRDSRNPLVFVVYINHETFDQLKYELDMGTMSFTENCTDCDFMINGCLGYTVSMRHPPIRVAVK